LNRLSVLLSGGQRKAQRRFIINQPPHTRAPLQLTRHRAFLRSSSPGERTLGKISIILRGTYGLLARPLGEKGEAICVPYSNMSFSGIIRLIKKTQTHSLNSLFLCLVSNHKLAVMSPPSRQISVKLRCGGFAQ
jgi:hypothetical protein